MKDFFVSYNKADRKWAEWIAWTLEEAGYPVVIRAWDFRPGGNFVLEMQSATACCEGTIAVLSRDYLNGEYTHPEWAAALARDPKGEKRTLIPVRVRECKLEGLLAPITYVDLVGLSDEAAKRTLLDDLKERGKPEKKPPFPGRVAAAERQFPEPIAFPGHAHGAPAEVQYSKSWPVIEPDLYGRDEELQWLDDAWATGGVNVVTLVAWGGVGKTALTDVWLKQRMQPDDWHGAERVYAWSFYSQGAKEGRQASADAFVADALRWFGDPKMAESAVPPWEKGVRLAHLVQQQRTLLVLDGMEPLQHPPGSPTPNRLKDPAVQGLLQTLATGNRGLCVVTTRLAVEDLKAFEKTSVWDKDLEDLSDDAGAEYLRRLGVEGAEEELRTASREFNGHALALSLLGHYISVVLGGDIRRRDEVPALMEDEKAGGHAKRVMAGYEKWFSGKPELDILHITGLFDRPVELDAVGVLRAGPVIEGLTDKLEGLTEAGWKFALEHLREARLLAREPGEGDRVYLDSHPLVREHFGDRLRAQHPEAWKEAHSRLYEYYKALPQKELPDTVEEMQPLYLAVGHGCQAGRYQEAFKEVYLNRIQRRSEFYNVHKLGAFGADLAMVAGFFDEPWRRPVAELAEGDRSWLLSVAGYDLRSLGRLAEAAEPMEAALQAAIEQKKWRNAAIRAENLSELYLTLGEVDRAVEYAKRGVEFADRSEEPVEKRDKRTTLADALHQAGRADEAEDMFREAETMQQQNQPEFQYLYSVQGYQYCGLLLEQGKYPEVIERASQTLEWAKQATGVSLLDIALNNLSLGRAYLLAAEREGTGDYADAAEHLNRAVPGLRKAGQQFLLPSGLLARAALYRVRGEFDRADQDLREVMDLAARCGMRLYETDAHLEYARLYLAADRSKAREHIDKAEKLIADTGYHRRDADLADLKG